jgi:type IV pilus assembly protein PilB
MSEGRKRIGTILYKLGIITPEQLKEGLSYQKEKEGMKIGEALIQLGYANEVQVTQALARQFKIPYVDLSKGDIPPEVIEKVPKNVAEEHRILPIKKNPKSLIVACTDALDLFTLDNLKFILGLEVECALTTPTGMQKAIERYYGGSATGDEFSTIYQQLTQSDIQFSKDQEIDEGAEEEDDAPVIRLCTLIISDAVKNRASDIHIEPMERKLRIRYRVDGELAEQNSPPKKLQGSVLSRFKIMAGIDIAERRKPQDGRIKTSLEGRDIDLRVSSIPTNHGESIVMRILDKQKALVGLDQLGFHDTDYQRFQRVIQRPNGVFLVTGPTGSGKTTTLYAALQELNRPDVKIITAENPVEYNLNGINQCQIRHEIGLDFKRILKSMLRQAPNVILVGEIRDRETADIAIQAALTGHLVFSTLHTNDAPSSLTRLIDMGVKPFLCSAAVMAIMAQRLIRVLCSECKVSYTPTATELRSVGLNKDEGKSGNFHNVGGVSCENCFGNGYRGRMGVYELLEMAPELREAVFQNANTIKLKQLALQFGGMVSLQKDGCRKILQGTTTISEVLAITHAQDLEQ